MRIDRIGIAGIGFIFGTGSTTGSGSNNGIDFTTGIGSATGIGPTTGIGSAQHDPWMLPEITQEIDNSLKIPK